MNNRPGIPVLTPEITEALIASKLGSKVAKASGKAIKEQTKTLTQSIEKLFDLIGPHINILRQSSDVLTDLALQQTNFAELLKVHSLIKSGKIITDKIDLPTIETNLNKISNDIASGLEDFKGSLKTYENSVKKFNDNEKKISTLHDKISKAVKVINGILHPYCSDADPDKLLQAFSDSCRSFSSQTDAALREAHEQENTSIKDNFEKIKSNQVILEKMRNEKASLTARGGSSMYASTSVPSQELKGKGKSKAVNPKTKV